MSKVKYKILRLLRPLDVYTFRKFFIPLLVVLLLINLIFFTFFNKTSLHWKDFALFAVINILLQLILIPVIFKRVLYIIDGKWRVTTSLSIILTGLIFPLYSLFICVACLKNTNYKKHKSQNIFLMPLGLSLCLILFSFFSLSRDSSVIKTQMGSTAYYITNVIMDYGTFIIFKNKKESQCIEALNTKCVVDWYFKNLPRSTNTGIILFLAVDALVLYKIRNKMNKQARDIKPINYMTILEVVDNSMSYLKENNCSRIQPLSLSNPADFMTGIGVTYILQAYDERASRQFNRSAEKYLAELLNSFPLTIAKELFKDIATKKERLKLLNDSNCPP